MTNGKPLIEETEPQPDIQVEITDDKILFFDLDGTLVETNIANYLSYKKAIQSVLLIEVEPAMLPDGRFNRASLRTIFPRLSDRDYERIIKKKEEFFMDYMPKTELNSSLVGILARYAKTNKTVLVTNCRESRARMVLNYYQLTDKFCSLFFRPLGVNNVRINKFKYAIQALNISPELVIAFENEEQEILDAISAGIQCVNPLIRNNK